MLSGGSGMLGFGPADDDTCGTVIISPQCRHFAVRPASDSLTR